MIETNYSESQLQQLINTEITFRIHHEREVIYLKLYLNLNWFWTERI